jgi:ATP dependent DNA ligase domain
MRRLLSTVEMPFLTKRNTTKRSAPLPRRSGSTQITHLPTAIEAVRTPIKAIMTMRAGSGPGVQRPWSREKLPEGDWLYEIKHDGYRALAFKDGKDVRLVSRNKKAFDYPQLLEALKLLPAEHFILDGAKLPRSMRKVALRSNSPDIQKLWRCPVGLLRLRSALLGRQRSAQRTAQCQTQTPTSGAQEST